MKSSLSERARVSFLRRFPVSHWQRVPHWKDYYREKPEGEDTPELRACREEIWEALHDFSLKLICLSPAEFIHFGTTWELLQLVTHDVEDYEFLDWKKQVLSTSVERRFRGPQFLYRKESLRLAKTAILRTLSFWEIQSVGEKTILSCVYLRDSEVPAEIVLHGLLLNGQKHIVRIYGIHDNPKDLLAPGHRFLGEDAEVFLRAAGIRIRIHTLHYGRPRSTRYVRADMRRCRRRLIVYRMAKGSASPDEIRRWQEQSEDESLPELQ